MRFLIKLNLAENQLTEIPSEWTTEKSFGMLRECTLKCNKLTSLPDDFFSAMAKTIDYLDICENKIKVLPSMAKVDHFSAFYAGGNLLTALPPDAPMNTFICLDISRNLFKSLPDFTG